MAIANLQNQYASIGCRISHPSKHVNGSIVGVLVAVGQEVVVGAALVLFEAMKMEHSIRAPRDGVIKALYCCEGELVNDGATLVELEGIE
jgi:3-methylcrotonyl-CoA carboxylase alpha subunit